MLSLLTVPFDLLPTYDEGDSRILKQTEDPDLLACKLKPTIFSLADQGAVELPGIEKLRTEINAILCEWLESGGIKTSTLSTEGDIIFMHKEEVPPIEVVVKGAHVGSPKHTYLGMAGQRTRSGRLIGDGERHPPYVRFDWRNPLPAEDACLPDSLADLFIDTAKARATALAAYNMLHRELGRHALDLLDICFFMNTAGNTICAEVSTDNTRIAYLGNDPKLQVLFKRRDKETAIERAESVLQLIKSPPIARRRVILSGPFATGKTTLIHRMQEELGIPKLIDSATRPMRPGERQDFPYHFISRSEFEEKIAQGGYWEWVEFNGNYYGVPKEKVLADESWVMDILSRAWPDYWGKVPGLVGIYLNPPDEAELVRRARERGDSEEKILERLASMKDEEPSGYDYVLPGHLTLDEKFALIEQIVNGEI